MSGSRCYSQESFRRELIKRDQQCILSGLSAEVCEAAHIVNKEYLQSDSKEIRFTKQNGILLNSCLHKEFDLHFWTVDIDESLWIDKQSDISELDITCNIKLYPPAEKKKKNNLKLAIFEYTHITIPKACVPFFIHRNEVVVENFYNPNHFTYDTIAKHIKHEFKEIRHHEKYENRKDSINHSVHTTKITKINKTKKKKRVKYTNSVIEQIKTWLIIYKDQQQKPTLQERKEFSTGIRIDDKIFESRFIKYWNKV